MDFSRIGGIGAIGFACLIVFGQTMLAPAGLPVAGADVGEVTEFFGTNSEVVGVASALSPAVWVLATLFGAGAVAALRQSERDRGEAWSLVGLAGLLLQNATFAGIAATRLALATTKARGDAATLWAFHDALFTLNGTFLALALVGMSAAGRRAGLIRPWHGALGLVSATLLFSSATLTPLIIDHTGPLGLLGLAGWLMWVVWIFTYGVVLLRRSSRVTISAAA